MRVTQGKNNLTKNAFILVIVSFLLSTTVSLVSLNVMTKRNVREMNKVLATQIYDHIGSELNGPITAARTMSSDCFLSDIVSDEDALGVEQVAKAISRYLKGIESGLGYQSAFVIVDASGRYYTRDGLSRRLDVSSEGGDSWYSDFLASDDLYALDVDNDEKKADDLTVYVNAKITDKSENVLGVCGVGVRMNGIQKLFETFEQGFGVKINLVNADGIVEVDTDKENIEHMSLKDLIASGPSNDYVYQSSDRGQFVVTKYLNDLDWFLIVQSGSQGASGYARVILLNVVLCGLVMALLVFTMRRHNRQTTELMSASLVDHATRLNNRRAFEEDKASLMESKPDPDLVSVTVDVNGLKTINDTLGHVAGDELIRGAADCLYECLGPYGKVYRIGGDEFAAILHVPWSELEDLRHKLEQTVAAWSGKQVTSLSVSCGFASTHEFPEEDISELTRISDKRMYEDKTAYYERMGVDRRRT